MTWIKNVRKELFQNENIGWEDNMKEVDLNEAADEFETIDSDTRIFTILQFTRMWGGVNE